MKTKQKQKLRALFSEWFDLGVDKGYNYLIVMYDSTIANDSFYFPVFISGEIGSEIWDQEIESNASDTKEIYSIFSLKDDKEKQFVDPFNFSCITEDKNPWLRKQK